MGLFKRQRRWEAKEKWRRRRDEEAGGCIRQQVADALWELSGRFEVGLWYEYVRVSMGINQYDVFCGVVVDGVKLDQPHCRTAEECAKQILEEYKRKVERRSEPPPPPPPDPAEELLREYPELEAFGVEWVKKWVVLKERLIEIAKVLRRFPWMVEVVRRNPMSILHPYMVNAYVARDGFEVCLQLVSRTFCARGGEVREVKLELERAKPEPYEGKLREVYRPKGLFTFTAAAKEYVEIL